MKSCILAAILPCLALAADEAQFTFASVKTIPAVTAEAAAAVPEESLKALKDATGAKDWAGVVKSCDALLALPGTATDDRLAWNERKREACERLGRWDDALAAAKASLTYPAPSNAVHNARLRIVRLLREKLGNKDEAIRLGTEILDDESLPADWRADGAGLATDAANDKRDFVCGKNLLVKADALPTSIKKKADVRWRLITHCLFNVRPQPEDLIRERSASVVTNALFPPGDRVRCAIVNLERHRVMARDEDKTAPIPAVRAFLDEIGPAVSASEKARVGNAIFLNLKAASKTVAAEAVASAEALLANTNAAASFRIGAADFLSERARTSGDIDKARSILESCYPFPANKIGELESIAKKIGRTYILEDKCDAAVESYRRALAFNGSPDMTNRVNNLALEAYKTFFRHAEARDLCLARGDRVGAARLMAGSMDDRPGAKKLFREILADEKASRASRLEAWRWLFAQEPALADKYLDTLLGTTDASTNDMIKTLTDMVAARGGSSYSFGGNYAAARHAYSILERLHAATGRTWQFPVMQYAAIALCEARDYDAAAKVARDALAWKSTEAPADLYQLNLMAALLPIKGDEAAALKAVRAADAKFGTELPPKTRVSRLDRLGLMAVIGGNEPLARGLADYRKALFVPQPKREYVVHFSEKPITGLASFDTMAVKPEAQEMSRQYGGSMDFLVTDVGTGDRDKAIGTEKTAKNAPLPTIQVAFDAFGIHFRFEAPDAKAAEIAAGFTGGGSYEAYVAPGENQPYYCLLMDIRPNASVSFFNTTYNTTGHRRITNDDHNLYKSETIVTDTSVVSYIMLSWNAFATLIPADGTVWEFENIHWGRGDKAAWNGTESIHGRSTWGRLVFDMPEKARIEILKRVIFAARGSYMSAKSKGNMGHVDFWRDKERGDPEFYAQCVAPLVGKLDAYLPLVKVDMSDEDVLKVAEEALPGWRDIGYTIARLRTSYLADKFAE